MRRSLLRLSTCAAVLLCGVAPTMQAAVQNRIVGGAGTKAVAMPQSVSPKTLKASDLGGADGSAALGSMTLRFSMTEAQKAALTKLLVDQQNPGSAKYHQWLTPEQFSESLD